MRILAAHDQGIRRRRLRLRGRGAAAAPRWPIPHGRGRGRSPRAATRGRAAGRGPPAPRRDLADRVLVETTRTPSPTPTSSSSPCRTGSRPRWSPRCPPDLPVVDLGADFRLRDAARRGTRYYGGAARRHLDLRPARAARRSGRPSRRRPGREPRLLRDGRRPRPRPGARRRARRAGRRRGGGGVGHLRARAASRPTRCSATQVMGSMSAYKVGGVHQHTPEMEQSLAGGRRSSTCTLSFTPLLAPMPRGIVATCTATVAAGHDVEAILRAALRGGLRRRAVRPRAAAPARGRRPARWRARNAVPPAGARSTSTRVGCVVVSAIDNLGKGAAGQALQNANLIARPRRDGRA